MDTMISLEPQQLASLDALARERDVPREALIRAAVDCFIGQNPPVVRERHTRPAVTAAFGLWKDRPVDSLDYQQWVRGE